jgi:micrococcal nuclease
VPVRPTALLLVFACVACAALAGCTPSRPALVTISGTSTKGIAAQVTHVVDGDTIDVSVAGGAPERVRLLGIDTPETVKPNTPVQCFGPEASARTKALLPPGTAVVLQRDAEARDRYGRLLAYVWRRRDGLFVNRSLVTDGFARILSIEPNIAHRSDLGAARAEAATAGRGLWGTCGAGR